MKPVQLIFSIALTFVVMACSDKYEAALAEVTEIAKIEKKCQLESESSNSPDSNCNPLNLDIALDKAKVLGIKDARIQAARRIGEKQVEVENPELVIAAATAAAAADATAEVAADATAAAADATAYPADATAYPADATAEVAADATAYPADATAEVAADAAEIEAQARK